METTEDLVAFAQGLPDASGLDGATILGWIEAFATATPSSYTYSAERITIRSDGGGTSRKPGNMLLNWRRLFEVGPGVGVALLGAHGQGAFARALIGLYVWNKVWRGSEVPLGDAEASVLEALWTKNAGERTICSGDAFASTNALRELRGVDALDRAAFERCLDVLVRMGCIRLTDDSVCLREWVRKGT